MRAKVHYINQYFEYLPQADIVENHILKVAYILDYIKETSFSELLQIDMTDDNGIELEPYEVLVRIAIEFAQVAEAMNSYARANTMVKVG